MNLYVTTRKISRIQFSHVAQFYIYVVLISVSTIKSWETYRRARQISFGEEYIYIMSFICGLKR